MADVYVYKTDTGTIVPDAEVIQDQVQQEYKDTFGQDLIVTPNTPQGMLITAEVLARIAAADNNAVVANQINPNIAGGVFLYAIGALTGISPTPATHSQVMCNLTGVPGTIIPAGSLARDTAHNELFESVSEITLAIDGTGSVLFQAQDTGPVSVAPSTVTQIVSAVLGWESVTNPAAEAVLGSLAQSDQAFRAYRRNTLAIQGQALAGAIISGLYATTGVKSVSFRENVSNTTQVIDGVTMVGHSIYACVDGGTDEAVANVLLDKKSGGCAYNNGASSDPIDVEVTVPSSGQVMHILFDRPDLIPVLARVTVKINTSIKDPVTAVKDAILAYANGELDGEVGFTVGTSVSSFELGGAINRELPPLYVKKVEITLASAPTDWSTDEIPIALWEKATIVASSITVTQV